MCHCTTIKISCKLIQDCWLADSSLLTVRFVRIHPTTEVRGLSPSLICKFRRVIPLPSAVQNDRVQADFTNGILTLTLPKVEAANKRVVKINLVEQPSAAIAAENEQPANHEQPVNSETNDLWDSPTAEPAAV